MSTGEDEPSSGLSGRLRPRKSAFPNPQITKTLRKPESKLTHDKPKRTVTPSKFPNQLDDLTDKSDSPLSQILCPYCDKSFFSKLAVSKHIRRTHVLISKQDNVINCLFCNHSENDANDIIRHMVDNHPNQYFACYDCHTRFPSTKELAEHKLNVCEKQKLPYHKKSRPKTTLKKDENVQNNNGSEDIENGDKNNTEHGFNGIVISCELKPSHPNDPIDIEDNITTNLILPSSKSLGNVNVIEKNAIIVLDDLQWNKRIPSNFSFHNTDADQILSRLGVVHRSPRTGENNKKDWFKHIDDTNQKFEKCFDTSFYSKVASNVQENLTKFLDGSFNFNPDPENTIKTRKSKNSVVINTVEGFPILLAAEQFSRNVFDGYMPRTIAPKYKWKWENIENDKNFMSPEQIKRDSHANNCIITLVSSLDIWTQLCMRRKYEEKFSTSPMEKKIEKQNIIGKELKEILESRELPTSSSQVVKYTSPTFQARDTSDFPASLGLVPNPPNFDLKPAVLSGEWVRPRCYVCCACGAQTHDSKALSSHISSQHPNGQIQHYEIVGEVLLNSDILKHLYVPPSQLNNRTRPLRGFRDCTKCGKSISLEDLHQHMLDCAGDTPMVRRKCRYRPFGVRKRRPRLPDNTIRKEMRKDIRHQRHNRKTHMRPRPKIRTEVGDAETIRKMLADLPAKRHRVMANPLNPILRPRRKLTKQRAKLVIKKRAMDEMIRKPSGDMPKEKDFNNQKSSSGSVKPDGKVVHSVKRVASKILTHKSCLNKKNPVNKNRRKIFMTKAPEVNTASLEVSAQPSEGETNIETNQMSNENNSQRINLNDGGYNKREHGNTQKGSNNREGQDHDSSGQNNNSRDSFAPSQQVPLKHSIASLTASSETHDKSVQFHHMFLVQQECNNTTQHLPSGQRMFFENEAIVTKLDKPPLHFNHSEVLDPNMFQRNKLNKPRKGLNDCIAMLKNKLVEPNSNILPGHVSVQCGSDEPLGPEPPIMIERRHSTTDLNIDSAQRSLQMFYPDKTVEDTLQSYDLKNCVTSRSNTRHGHSTRREKIMDVMPHNDYLYWNQFYYNKQLMPLNNSTYKYNKRESTRRRSVISAEELLLQHAMNFELLANGSRNPNNFTDYQFPNISTPQKSTKKNRHDGPKMGSSSNNVLVTPKAKNKETSRTRQRNSMDFDNTQRYQQKISETSLEPIKTFNDKRYEHYALNNAASTVENVDHYYLQNRIEDKNTDRSTEKTKSLGNNLPQERLCSNVCSNIPILQYAKDSALLPVHYNMPLIAALPAIVPLDLSNKTNVEEPRRYPTEEPFCAKAFDRYKILNASSKNLNHVSEKETYINNDNVNLRFHKNSPIKPPRPTYFPSQLGRNLEDNATHLSFRHSNRRISELDDSLPTDLSTKGKDASLDLYKKRRISENSLELNMTQNLSHPIRHVPDIRMIVPRREDLDNEEPTDLSNKRTESSSNITAICISDEQQIRSNRGANNADRNNEETPPDLLNKNKGTHRDNYYRNEQRMPQYVEAEVLNNNEGGPVIEDTNPQLSLNSINSEQLMNNRYLTARIPLQPNALEPRSVVTFSESILDGTQNISSAKNLSTSSVAYDLPISINRSPIRESGARNDVPYLVTEMPLNLYAKKADEPNCCNTLCHESRSRGSEYEKAMSAYMLTQFQGIEPSNINTDVSYPLARPPTEVVLGHNLNAPSIMHTSNHIDKRRLSCGSEVMEGTKHLSNEKNLLPIYRLDTENINLETGIEKNNQTGVDQDSETARKIAMLPKELVEILGTMPVDHRNQLLNVLPQYVSSSTSPMLLSHNTESFRRDSVSLSANSASPKLTRNPSENDYTPGLTLEDRHHLPNHTSSSQISQYVEISPITVTSSILLTPPTPQLSDRYNQPQDNYEIKSIEYRRQSRISIEDQTPTRNMNSENMSSASQSSLVKRLTVDECERQDRIIDLTGDEFSPETPDASHNFESFTQSAVQPSKDTSSLIYTPKSNALKTNSDKTSSLRAVRIKTSSERQRSVLTENTLVKKYIDNAAHLIEEEPKNSADAIDASMAIQQAEITSTQQRPAITRSPIMLSKTVPCTGEQPINSILAEDKITASTIINNNDCRKHDTQDEVTSSRSKDTHCNSPDENQIDSKNRSHTNTTLSNKTDKELSSYKSEVLSVDNIMTGPKSLITTDPRHQFPIEDDDSEDDVTLAVIVKQKNRDLKTAHDDVMICEENSDPSTENKKSDLMSFEKPSSEEQNQISLSCNNHLTTDTGSCEPQSLNKSIEISNNTKISEYSESQAKEKVAYPKKKGRKGRRVNILDTPKYIEELAHLGKLDKIDSECEIREEINRFTDGTKNVEVTHKNFKTKSILSATDHLTSTPISIINDIDDNSNTRKDKANVSPNLSIDSQASGDTNLNSRNSEDTVVREIIQDRGKEDFYKNKPIDSNWVDSVSGTKTCDSTLCKDLQKIENNEKSQLLENSEKIVETQVNDDRNLGDTHETKESNDIHCNIKQVENGIDKKSVTEIEEANLTLLRRSRRGKSLFIDSNSSIMSEHTTTTENTTEQKAPLTKKQLIFSKLLQDEENHKRPILTTTHDKQIIEPASNTQNENQQDIQNENEFNKDHLNEVKTNKRKKSPQSKRKYKKKKSLMSLQTADEAKDDTNKNNNEEFNSQKSNDLSPATTVSTLQVTSQLKTNNLITETINTPIESTDDHVNVECSTKQLIPTEKRKSISTDRDDSLSMSKPKKSKLNEKTQVSIMDKKDVNICEKIINTKESKGDLPATVSSRITTCYNKATKRARSKSVVVKSSGSELYDPYDIDLEDMADKTEPFVRTAITPKISFNTFKSTLVAKTKKLIKTLPSAFIDILPSDSTSSAIDAGSENLNADKINNTPNSNRISVITTKDGNTDSDESTKSDVPLKKLVEDKEKKLAEIDSTTVPECLTKSENITSLETCIKSRQKSKPRKKNKHIEHINDSEPKNNNNKTESEEELRSEQFMESFGFFSERKPRKSNLLATKKISETFSLIENDDVYFASKERVTKKSANDNRKEEEAKTRSVILNPKKVTKRGRKKKRRVKIKPSFCNLCQRAFRRQQLNRLKVLQNKIAKRKKNCLSTADIILPTLEEILADVKRTIRRQQLSRLGLSRDEALFIDCCEMLKESNPNDISTLSNRVRHCNSFNCALTCQEELVLLEKSILDDRCDVKADGEMDSITAKKILESDEVRNLEKDLISNLKEANGLKGALTTVQTVHIETSENITENITEAQTVVSNRIEIIKESSRPSNKKQGEIKNKLYPDVVENIDMFEDKFDKIKRKCRSQAAAAKQIQTHVEINASHKSRKKSDKKKVKSNTRKGLNAVPTKAALKGFDGVKVSILTSDINMSAIVPSVEKPHKKKKKSSSKKKRDRKSSEKSNYESDHCNKESSQKKIDVYEFMDTEDTEVFELRPSTLMERFKSTNNKELPSTSKSIKENELAEISSESGSDGDDFVYMSDDYVCSEDETENSTLSCDLGNGKGTNEYKKPLSPPKRKDITEKSAVMGKIFKYNAVRTEKKSPKNREFVKPKANLDQLFDSLLENEPNHSKSTKDTVSPEKDEIPTSRVYLSLSPQKDDFNQTRHFNKSSKRFDLALSLSSETGLTQKYSTPSPTLHPSLSSFSSRRKSITPPRKLELNINSASNLQQESTISRRNDDYKKCETTKELDTSKETYLKKYDAPKETQSKKYEPLLLSSVNYTSRNLDETLRRQSDDFIYEKDKSREKFSKDKSEKRNKDRSKYEKYDFSTESFDQATSEDAGVARQRARRKCTVGKQNVLAETWSSESEPDGLPPRPNSVESVVAGSGRKKRGRKRDGQSSSNRKASKLVSTKKYDYESKVGSSDRSFSSGGSARPRPSSYYWSEGDEEQEHPQQHGWIVGDSHKKLVTMLAHAKGRKRSGDEKHNLLE